MISCLVAGVIGCAIGVIVRRVGVFPCRPIARMLLASAIAAAVVSLLEAAGALPR